MQKNGEIRAKIGVDTADILILWPSAKIKMKVQNFVLENLHPAYLAGERMKLKQKQPSRCIQ